MDKGKHGKSAKRSSQLSLPLNRRGTAELDAKSRRMVVEALAKLLLEAASRTSEVCDEST